MVQRAARKDGVKEAWRATRAERRRRGSKRGVERGERVEQHELRWRLAFDHAVLPHARREEVL